MKYQTVVISLLKQTIEDWIDTVCDDIADRYANAWTPVKGLATTAKYLREAYAKGQASIATPQPARVEAVVIKYVGTGEDSGKEDKHPKDKEPRCDELRAVFKRMGDDTGQGLHPYWKWAFAAGFSHHPSRWYHGIGEVWYSCRRGCSQRVFRWAS